MFQIGGLASGIDSTALIDQLMLLERKPIMSLETRKASISKQESALQGINTRLNALKSKLSNLMLAKTMNAKSATSSDEAKIGASAGSGAIPGAYKIQVKQLASATTASSSAPLGKTINTANMTLAGLRPASGATVTTGTFTIGGATVTIGSSNATLDELVNVLNTGTSDTNVTIAGSTGLGTSAFAVSDGRLTMNVTANPSVAVGSGADSSNFLDVVGLRSPSIGNVTPGDGMSRVGARLSVANAGAELADANLNHALTTDGVFKINGVEIAYSTSDSLEQVISRINSSSAGVSAHYNSLEDRFTLTSKSTGNTAIMLEEVSPGFLTAVGLDSPVQELGKNARVIVEGYNGNSPVESATNEFKNIAAGVVFTVKGKHESSEWATVSVGAAPQTAIDAVKGFIDEFNATVNAIASARGKGQPLASDSSLSSIYNQLFRMVYEPVAGLDGANTTLSSIGIGTTKDNRTQLSLDETKFKAALESNPERVAELFSKTDGDKKLGMAARLNAYLDELGGEHGVFTARKESYSRQTAYLNDQIEKYELRIEQRRKTLVNQFTAMERSVALMQSQQSAMMAQLGSLQSR